MPNVILLLLALCVGGFALQGLPVNGFRLLGCADLLISL